MPPAVLLRQDEEICYTIYCIIVFREESFFIMLIMEEVLTKAQRKKFIAFQNELYRNKENYIPTLLPDELANLNKKVNPAFDFCDARFFLCYRDGKAVGRVGGIINRAANERWGKKDIRITRIDFIEDMEVARLLVKTIEDWGREAGMERMVGPMGFCDFDKEGMLIEGFEHMGMFITYYNFPYYPKFFEEMGFAKEVDWIENRVYVKCLQEEKIARICQRVIERGGYKLIVPKTKRQVKPYVKRLLGLVSREYSDLYGFTPITDRQKDYYQGQFLQLLNLKYVNFIEDKNGELVAFGLLAPSFAECMKKTGGRLFPFGFITVLRAIRHPKVLDMYFVAISKEHQKTGLPAVLLHNMTKTAEENGILYAETGPELENNTNVQGLWTGYEMDKNYKRRRCWQKEIAR